MQESGAKMLTYRYIASQSSADAEGISVPVCCYLISAMPSDLLFLTAPRPDPTTSCL
jgi:hypothetical protein